MLVIWIVLGAAALVLVLTSIKMVRQGEVLVIERLGKYHDLAEEGLNIIIPFLDTVRKRVDVREHFVEFQPVSAITKDNVSVEIDSVLYYQVTDPRAFTYGASDPIGAIATLCATVIRNQVGGMDLDETLTSREVINAHLKEVLDQVSDRYGLRVTRVEIKNIDPPKDVMDAMEKQMRAERQKREAILTAEGEKQSAILTAEGQKQAAILQAEAAKEKAIREAEGRARAEIIEAEAKTKAIRLVAEATAEAERTILSALKDADPTKEVIAIRAMEAIKAIADGKATKIILPSELTGIGALAAAVKESTNT